MNNDIKKVCVFASSSNFLDEVYYEDARLLGNLLGKNGYDVVYVEVILVWCGLVLAK